MAARHAAFITRCNNATRLQYLRAKVRHFVSAVHLKLISQITFFFSPDDVPFSAFTEIWQHKTRAPYSSLLTDTIRASCSTLPCCMHKSVWFLLKTILHNTALARAAYRLPFTPNRGIIAQIVARLSGLPVSWLST